MTLCVHYGSSLQLPRRTQRFHSLFVAPFKLTFETETDQQAIEKIQKIRRHAHKNRIESEEWGEEKGKRHVRGVLRKWKGEI